MLFSASIWAQDPATPAAAAGATPSAVVEKELEVAMGIDVIEKIDFDYSLYFDKAY